VIAATGVGGVDRIPPNNLEAEMAVLGSILVDREMMATVGEILAPQRLLRSRPRHDLTALLAALRARRAARQDHARRRVAPPLAARQGRRLPYLTLADGHRSDRRLGRVLREDRAREARCAA
jgi:hypothetical protein